MILKAENLGKRFGAVWALRQVNLNLESKRIAIMGPNGSGKSTFLMIASGIAYPSEGRLYINGREPYRARDWAVENIHFIFEKPKYSFRARVKDIVELVSDMRGCKDEGKAIAEKIGLEEFYNTSLSDLSFGQAQLLGIWLSVACHRGLVVIDEPFAHLDLRKTALILEVLREVNELVYTTHNPEEAEALADSIIILDRGRVVWSGFVKDFFREDVYEVLPRERSSRFQEEIKLIGCNPLAEIGLHLLVTSCSESKLEELMRKGLIIGFRRAGVRSVYAELFG